MAIPFYKKSDGTFVFDNTIVPPAQYQARFNSDNTMVKLRGLINYKLLLDWTLISDITKENGSPYADKDEFLTDLYGFF